MAYQSCKRIMIVDTLEPTPCKMAKTKIVGFVIRLGLNYKCSFTTKHLNFFTYICQSPELCACYHDFLVHCMANAESWPQVSRGEINSRTHANVFMLNILIVIWDLRQACIVFQFILNMISCMKFPSQWAFVNGITIELSHQRPGVH